MDAFLGIPLRFVPQLAAALSLPYAGHPYSKADGSAGVPLHTLLLLRVPAREEVWGTLIKRMTGRCRTLNLNLVAKLISLPNLNQSKTKNVSRTPTLQPDSA